MPLIIKYYYFKMTKIFKFGGASLRDAANIRNVATILGRFRSEKLVIVVSAMGKTTNALEDVVHSYFKQDGKAFDLLNDIRKKHFEIMDALFEGNRTLDIYAQVNDTFVEVEWVIEDEPHDAFDYVYDQIVSVGELVSSKIVAAYLNTEGVATQWLDARDVLRTDDTWREAVIDWKTTEEQAKRIVPNLLAEKPFAVTQGFIGSTADNNTATLGREGSDYSAAIFSFCLDAEAMYIWKDVDGVLSGDPRVFKNTQLLTQIGYDEAVEMTYYGATVVHPRTIQPLMAKKIPLNVRSFLNPDAVGTIISAASPEAGYPPIFMAERNQVFLKVSNPDFTFLVEPHIRDLFAIFSEYHIFVNLMQNSGACFYLSITHVADREAALMQSLREKFVVEEIPNVDLFTIRHANAAAIAQISEGKTIYFERTVPNTYQVVLG